jgi:hypothetical protein
MWRPVVLRVMAKSPDNVIRMATLTKRDYSGANRSRAMIGDNKTSNMKTSICYESLCKKFVGQLQSYIQKIHVCTKLGISYYSQTCVKRSPMGQRKSGLIRHMKFSMTGQEKGDLLIQVTAWAGLTVIDIQMY